MSFHDSRRTFLGQAGAMAGLAGGLLGGGMIAYGEANAAGISPNPSSPCVDVMKCGAQGDGVADDSEAIQAAVDSLIKQHGGRLYFPAGRYRITRPILFSSAERIDIAGDGFSSVLLHEGTEHLLVWKESVSCRESSVRDLCITATTAKPPETAAIACLGGAERSLFCRLLFNNIESVKMSSGIVVKEVMDTTTVEHCQFWNVRGTGIEIAKGSEVRIFGGRVIGDSRSDDAAQSIGILLTGNNGGVHVVTTDLIGLNTSMQIGVPNGPSNREIFITHATFDSSVHGLVQYDNAYTSIAGCWAASCDEEQILVQESAFGAILSITGGTIFNGGAYGKPGAHNGLVFRGGSFMLSGATIRHNKGTGILVDNPNCRNYTITGCRIADNGVGAVLTGNDFAFTGNVLARNATQIIDKGGINKSMMGNVYCTA